MVSGLKLTLSLEGEDLPAGLSLRVLMNLDLGSLLSVFKHDLRFSCPSDFPADLDSSPGNGNPVSTIATLLVPALEEALLALILGTVVLLRAVLRVVNLGLADT